MSLVLDENESFSMIANVTSTGPQNMVLKGYLVSRRPDGVYIASLLPQMFYGVSGAQLGASWRQNLTSTGSQVILSRAAGGYPEVPKEEIYWRKISDSEEKVAASTAVSTLEIPSWVIPAGFLIVAVLALYMIVRK